jgi:hypothetical protein
MKKKTYILIHRITREPLAIPHTFASATAAALFALIHDYHAEVVPL